MADISDVENALVSLLVETIYPSGTDQPSIIGGTCRIYRGWPNANTLNNDLSNEIANVTVASDNDSGRLTTRYLPKLQTSARSPGVAVAVNGGTVMIGGRPGVNDLIGLIVDGAGFAYRVQANDTADMVAANLGQIVRQVRPVTVFGANLTLPGAYSIAARTVADSMTLFETRRQEKNCRIMCWCPSPDIRDTICLSIDTAMAKVTFLPLPDGSFARVSYSNTASFDQAQDALLYRRDLVFTVEYPTISSTMQPSMLFGDSALNGNITVG